MKFSVKTMESESVGVKNAEPLTIDNMGKYISYIKKNESGNLDVYIESNVQDREKVALETPFINSVLVSSDYRSFVFECGNISTFKSVGSDPFTILAKTGSGLEIKIDEYSSYNVFENKDVSFVEKVCYCENRSFLPYYYIDSNDGQNQVMVADKTGNKTPLFDKTFSEYKSSGKNIAFISNGSLYTAQINNKDAATSLVSENFSGYSLTDISNNGKYIFFSDEDGNMYRMPYKYDGSNMTKIAVDAVFLEPSDNGKTALFVSNSALSILNKNLKIKKVSEKVDEKSVYFLEKFSKLLYIENENDSKSLYLYKNNKQNLLSSNIKQVISYPFLNLGYGNIAGDSDISDN